MSGRLLVILFASLVAMPSHAADFIMAEGLAITPFAQEQLSNPCSIDVDDRGRVWVGEATNYRKKARKEGDRILILEDTNEDGRADLTKVFYQNPDIDGVHGVCVLGNKVIISAPDRILILTDIDGDDKADQKKLLFMGRVLNPVHGQHDHAIHAVMYGPDGRFHDCAASVRQRFPPTLDRTSSDYSHDFSAFSVRLSILTPRGRRLSWSRSTFIRSWIPLVPNDTFLRSS